MVEQVNRLVGNMLAAGGEVYFPEVGTLATERRPARRISKREVEPPYRAVVFSSQQRGTSLVDEIARVIRNATPDAPADEQAKEVYSRWLARVREGEVLTIEGIGVLKLGHFAVDGAFDRRLNPQGREPIHIRARGGFDWVMAVGIIAAIAVCGAVGYWWCMENPDIFGHGARVETVEIAEVAEEPAAETPLANGPAAGQVQADSVAVVVAEEQQMQTPSRPSHTVAADPTVPTCMVQGRCYVVLGVFSTPENAARALRAAMEKNGHFTCAIYHFGAKYMVSAYESDDSEVCAKFIRENSDRQPDMWRYTAR